MATVTVSIPDELKSKLNKYPEVNWTEVLRRALAKRIELLKRLKKEHGGEL